MEGLERLSVIRSLSEKRGSNWIHKDLFRLLNKTDIWISAYENIKSNKGALTPGITNITLDGISLAKIERLQQKVLDESYQFSPVKQVFIPKPNGKRRPLGLPTSNDKIVQEVIKMILEAVYEPNFDNRSFGFRQNMGVHDALSYVDDKFRWVDWVIKGDIKNAYPTINHDILVKTLCQRIDDFRFIRLINKSLNSGTFINPNTIYSKLGVPQGSIVSPILANIYFDRLDQKVSELTNKYSSENSKKRSPEYKRLEYKIRKINEKLNEIEHNSKEHDLLVKEIKQLIRERSNTASYLNEGIKIRYVRYADDWMIGIKGPKQLASQIKEEISEFLQSELNQELDPVKTTITNLRKGKVTFLGYEIFLPRNMKLTKYKKKGGKMTIRRSSPMLRFQIPVKSVVKRLNERGYVTYKNNEVRPISKASYSTLEDSVIVNHFRSVWLGLSNFYSGSTNFSHLQYIQYLLQTSCAMTLAHRHRSTSRSIFQKHGKYLEIKDNKNNSPDIIARFPLRTSWKVADRKWQKSINFRDPFKIYANRVSKTKLGSACSICESKYQVEMHHIKHVRKEGHRYTGIEAEMSLLTRKQIPLCRKCHMAVHKGKYDGIKLTKLS